MITNITATYSSNRIITKNFTTVDMASRNSQFGVCIVLTY